MDEQGGADANYEEVRRFRDDPDYFEIDFELDSDTSSGCAITALLRSAHSLGTSCAHGCGATVGTRRGPCAARR